MIPWLKRVGRRIKDSGWLPNILSMLRLVSCWLPPYFICTSQPARAMIAFALIAATDALDGHLARHWQQITQLGKILDPLADKLLVGSTMLTLALTATTYRRAWWILLGLIVAIELFIVLSRSMRQRSKRIVPSSPAGKLRMVLQSAALFIAPLPWQAVRTIALLLLAGSVIFATIAAYGYAKAEGGSSS